MRKHKRKMIGLIKQRLRAPADPNYLSWMNPALLKQWKKFDRYYRGMATVGEPHASTLTLDILKKTLHESGMTLVEKEPTTMFGNLYGVKIFIDETLDDGEIEWRIP